MARSDAAKDAVGPEEVKSEADKAEAALEVAADDVSHLSEHAGGEAQAKLDKVEHAIEELEHSIFDALKGIQAPWATFFGHTIVE